MKKLVKVWNVITTVLVALVVLVAVLLVAVTLLWCKCREKTQSATFK